MTVGDAFRRLALPLAAYYGITLAVPLANGAWRSGIAFAEHSMVVFVVPPILIVLVSLLRLAGLRLWSLLPASRGRC